MKLIESFLTKNPCYITGRKITAKGIMLESVGCPQPSAKVFINNWNRESYIRGCPHALIDAADGTVYQTLPLDYRGWHSDSEHNDKYLGVMMCEPSQIRYQGHGAFTVVGDKKRAENAVTTAYWSAVAFCAKLCEDLGLDPATQIFSKSELSDDEYKSVKDPEHLWIQMNLPFSMDGFRSDVKGYMLKEPVENDEDTLPQLHYYDEQVVSKKEDSPIKIRISIPNLRIRKGPGTGEGCEPIGKYTGIGEFELSEIKKGSGNEKGWGRLASGEGWVSMDFVEVIS